MPNKLDRVPGSVAGRYYIDNTCLACGLCAATAPANIKFNAEVGASIVYKQPTTQEEIKLLEQAISECCVDAIGRDGTPLPDWAVP